MSVVVADFIAPRGEVEANFFPGEVVNARIQEYLTEASSKVVLLGLPEATEDAALKAYVYYKVYKAVYLSMSRDPATATLNDQGSRQYTDAQIARFRILASDYLTEFQGYLPASSQGETPAPAVSTRMRNVPTW